MKNHDYIPRGDVNFDVWQGNMMQIVEANGDNWGIPADALSALKNKQAAWNPAYFKASNRNNRSSADVVAKNEARRDYEKSLRNFIFEWLARNSKIKDDDRERMGLTVRKTTHTPMPVPTSFPSGRINFLNRLQHSIYFHDESAGKAKPFGVHGCEIYISIREASANDSGFTYLAMETRSPYIHNFKDSDAGKIAYYRLRWVNTRGKPGPWSDTFNAIIAP